MVLRILRRAERHLERFARHRRLSCLAVVLIALTIRAVLLPLLPIPTPIEHDEFSYILGGETLASGRLANPPHPMWRFFETMHVNMQPTYVSKYPPAQAAFLALGIKLFGHPWYGVWLSVGLLCGALCWMLQGWIAPKYAVIGSILACMQLGVTGYWINSYWGGAVPALGGALVIGALPRLALRPSARAGVAAAAGIALLANSRPFEGAILVVLLALALVLWSRRRRLHSNLFRASVMIPIIGGVLLTTAAMAYYNWKTTGNAFLMPYILNTEQYRWAPPLWFMPASSPPANFRDSAMKQLWEWDHSIHAAAQKNPVRVAVEMIDAGSSAFMSGPSLPLLVVFAAGLLLVNVLLARIAAVLLAAFLCLLLSEHFILPHYMAPGLGLLLIVLMFGLRLFRTVKVRQVFVGLPLVTTILAFSFALFLGQTMQILVHARSLESNTRVFRARTLQQLNSKPGRHLVLVRYGPDHDFHHEDVYNGPDIDAQKVIWALDRGKAANEPLLAYYGDRTVWLFEPDGATPSLRLLR